MTRDREFDRHAYPLNQIFDEQEDWFYDWRNYWKEREKDVSDWRWDFGRAVITRITSYKIPVIKLHKENSREAICLIFEKVNMGGQPLDTFELLTAMYSAEYFYLRQDWNGPLDKSEPGRRDRILGSPNRIDVLSGVAKTDFLQACALLYTHETRLARVRDGAEGRVSIARVYGPFVARVIEPPCGPVDGLLSPLGLRVNHLLSVKQGPVW